MSCCINIFQKKPPFKKKTSDVSPLSTATFPFPIHITMLCPSGLQYPNRYSSDVSEISAI